MKNRFAKKLTNILLIFALVALSLSALAESAPTYKETVEGIIEEVREDGILITPHEGVAVLARLPEDLVIDGPDALMPGMPVIVTYNGIMTRSIPAQITAETVVIPTLTGAIVSVETDRFLMEQDDDLGPVFVRLTEDSVIPEAYDFEEGSRLQVVFSGIMALSMPPQTNALFVLPLPLEAGEPDQPSGNGC